LLFEEIRKGQTVQIYGESETFPAQAR